MTASPPPNRQKSDAKQGFNKFPIVGIGASAGGLEALNTLFQNLPPDTGMAFAVVQHLSPTHPSILAELLGGSTKMKVVQAAEDMRVEPNHVYVIPPNKEMTIADGHLKLSPRMAGKNRHMPIDYFLCSLAEVQKSRAIGVVLSGTASDGTLGLKSIKSEGGITFVQNPDQAQYEGMPRSAIAAGCADFVYTLEQIARELTTLGKEPYVVRSSDGEDEAEPQFRNSELILQIFMLLKKSTGVDFRQYKHSTMSRRIQRRMVLNKMKHLGEYAAFLQNNPSEIEALYKDILIKVTRFFRDPEVFEFLKKTVFPALVAERPSDSPVRVWVPGCATGEEAYSLAICLLEAMSESGTNLPVQIFATDVSAEAIAIAREGRFLDNITLDISPDRLRRFFVKSDGGYQISKPVREVCIFARQNLTADPPFSKVDLISCRNLLIYLEASLQKKVLPLFHYALKPSGFLMLGASETPSAVSDLFTVLESRFKIFRKSDVAVPIQHIFGSEAGAKHAAVATPEVERTPQDIKWTLQDSLKQADDIILERFSAAGVIVDINMQIVQFRGDTTAFLQHVPGEPSLNVLKMAAGDFQLDLRTLIHHAFTQNQPQKKEVAIPPDASGKTVRLEVLPLGPEGPRPHFCMILFQKIPAPGSNGAPPISSSRPPERESEMATLRAELTSSRRHLQAIIEEQEGTNEELQTANEEILSSNEELQSINEEMETAREELESTNEELTTLNDELQDRNREATLANNDLSNLLSSVNIPIVMLGRDLRIRRFTLQAEKLLRLISSDIGRPIGDIRPKFEIPDFEQVILDVIDTVTVKELEVQDHSGKWYSIVIRPYKTSKNKIDGAVITVLDIDALKKGIEAAFTIAESIFRSTPVSMLALNSSLQVVKANEYFYKRFQVAPGETLNQFIYNLGNRQWNIPALKELLNNVIVKNATFEKFPVEHVFDKLGFQRMLVTGRKVALGMDTDPVILLIIENLPA